MLLTHLMTNRHNGEGWLHGRGRNVRGHGELRGPRGRESCAQRSEGLRLVWLHTMPFSQLPAIERLNFNDCAFITACDLASDPMLIDVDPANPNDAMARRLVYSCMNGPAQARIDRALDLVR